MIASHRACCPACNKDVRLRKNGHLFVHGPLEVRCYISDQAPSQCKASLHHMEAKPHAFTATHAPFDSLLSDIRFA